eukprot:2634_1
MSWASETKTTYTPQELEIMDLKELTNICKGKGISIHHNTKKAKTIIKKIIQHQSNEIENKNDGMPSPIETRGPAAVPGQTTVDFRSTAKGSNMINTSYVNNG